MRLAGWEGLARQVAATRQATGAAFVAADGYALASELAWWMPAGVEVVSTEARWRLLDLPRASIGENSLLLAQDFRRAEVPDFGLMGQRRAHQNRGAARIWDELRPVPSNAATRPGSGCIGAALERDHAGRTSEACESRDKTRRWTIFGLQG